MSYRVRPALAADVPLLGALERTAAQRFAGIGLARIAQGRPTSEAEYHQAVAGGRLWVVEQEGAGIVGLAIADLLAGAGYLAEHCVHPVHDSQRRAARMIAGVADRVAAA